MPRCVPNRHVGCEAWLFSSSHQWWRMYDKRASISSCTWIMIIFRVFRVNFVCCKPPGWYHAWNIIQILQKILLNAKLVAVHLPISEPMVPKRFGFISEELPVHESLPFAEKFASIHVPSAFILAWLFGPQLAWPLYTMWPAWRPVVVQPRWHGTMPQTEFSKFPGYSAWKKYLFEVEQFHPTESFQYLPMVNESLRLLRQAAPPIATRNRTR